MDKDLSNGYYTVLFLVATVITFVKTRLGKCRLCFADEAQKSRNSFPWLPEICPGNPGGGGGESYMKQTGMLVVSLRGVNFGFWSRLGCSGQIF